MTTYYLFDFDGTIVDSMPYWHKMDVEYLTINGIKARDDIHEVLWPLSVRETATYYHDSYGVDKDVDQIVEEMYELATGYYETQIGLKPGLKDFLDKIERDGDKASILTLTRKNIIEANLKLHGLEGRFDPIFTTMDTGMSKRFPEIYYHAMDSLGSSLDNTVFIEDSLYALKVARGIGMKVIGVYEEYSKEDWPEIQSICDLAIRDFRELL